MIGASLRDPSDGGAVQGLVAELDGRVGVRVDDLQTLILGVRRRELMGGIGMLALAANLTSVLLLHALQGRRRQRALGLALLAQRRNRQRHSDGGGA